MPDLLVEEATAEAVIEMTLAELLAVINNYFDCSDVVVALVD